MGRAPRSRTPRNRNRPIGDTGRVTISTGARRHLDTILAAQPEAAPWLGVLSTVLVECSDATWDAAASRTRLQAEREAGAPLLAGAEIAVDRRHAERWPRLVLELAGNVGAEADSLRAAASSSALDPLLLLEMAINQDIDGLTATAVAFDLSLDTLSVAAGLAAMPLLQAIRRRFGNAADPRWKQGYCPVCGDWPLLAEVRGLERAHRLRCGRCGGDWAQPGVRCPFCDASGHGALSALVPEEGGEARKVETCTRCRGYLKSISTLRAWAGDEIPLADLSTVELDLVAIERDYARPAPRELVPGVRVMG